jgi:ABC-type multidrug transport system fused ATPase/permease subunit
VAQLVETLRYSRKVAGSMSDGVTRNFYWHISSGRTMTLGLTQPSNRNEYQAHFLGGKMRSVRVADNLTTFMCRMSWNLVGALTSWKTQGLSRPVMGLLYLMFLINLFRHLFSTIFVYQTKVSQGKSKHRTLLDYKRKSSRPMCRRKMHWFNRLKTKRRLLY